MRTETYEDGVLIAVVEDDMPEPEAPVQVDDIAAALAALPPDTLAALRAALGL